MSQKNSNQKEQQSTSGTQKGKRKERYLLTACIALFIALFSLLFGKELPGGVKGLLYSFLEEEEGFRDTGGDELVITYLDVGQADCTILQCGGYTMMIDGGGRGSAQEVIEATSGLGIDKLDYVVATHSHEDHIGGLPKVIRAFPVGTVVFRQEDNDSKIYGDFKDAVKESGAEVIVPKPGVSFEFGNALVEFYAPQEMEYSKTNNYSAALCITFGKRKFFFSGDAEEESEEQMLGLGTLPDVDVFQAGHHGSQTSNTEAFLKAIDPAYAVISCGEDNKYGHPHSEVIARYQDMDMQIYRTDTMGTITIKTDGKSLEISTQRK
ncbi:MAG: MBL fold metallo-hydrolase [Lachnospiraceae bacterium]|nr:MBL fold metallo-hydrolase [Lachnospiraceae bacterium]